MANQSTAVLVRGIREKTGWTQEKLAQEVGVSFSTVNSWERGKRNPQPYLLKKLMELAEEPSVKQSGKS
ncbi:multiprotein-bridging factor 1 family protein [Thermodesulfobacteriota bacterium]